MKVFATVLTMLASIASADQGETNLESISKKLSTLYPATQFNEIRLSQFEGMYEVVMGKNIGYTDTEGRYFLFGHVFDMQTRQDLTQQRIDELNKVNFADLPLKDAIKEVRGKGQRKLAVFSDPDCPFCKKLEQELPYLDNVTIYTFPMPLEGLHPSATQTAKSIWCSSKRQSAWRDYLLSNKQPTGKTDCSNPIERNVLLGQKLGISGTPTLIAEDGRVMPGAASADQIENWLNLKGGN
jgi:thiol:disulfide interchange protein DsbC